MHDTRARRWLLMLLMCAMPALPARAGAVVDAARLGRELDAWARAFADAGLLSGNLLVTHQDHVLLERSWGWADAERKQRNTPATRFNIASITKPMTVAVAIQLLDEGSLAMSDPLSKWIADFPNGDSITVGMLLQHRSGIPHRVTQDADERVPHTAADMVEFAKHVRLEFPPGSRESYSSGGFSVLARVLELASGKSYGELLTERLFRPLAMTSSFHPYAHTDTAHCALSYVPEPGRIVRAPHQDYSFLVGAGSVWSTPRDLHKLIAAELSGALGESVRRSTFRRARVAWNGSTNGYRAFASYDTASQYAVIFTGNLHSGAVDELKAAVDSLLAGRPPKPASKLPARAAPVAPTVLASYEGAYNIANNPSLAVRATATGLDVNGWAVMPTSDSTFFSFRDFGKLTAWRDSAGRFMGFDWNVAGQVFKCPRVGPLPPR
ncbi:MAG: serine hydrolase domain-containing protein [Candidatus Eisenbacteria bacterium]